MDKEIILICSVLLNLFFGLWIIYRFIKRLFFDDKLKVISDEVASELKTYRHIHSICDAVLITDKNYKKVALWINASVGVARRGKTIIRKFLYIEGKVTADVNSDYAVKFKNGRIEFYARSFFEKNFKEVENEILYKRQR